MQNNWLDSFLTIFLALLSLLMLPQRQDKMTTVPSLCPIKTNIIVTNTVLSSDGFKYRIISNTAILTTYCILSYPIAFSALTLLVGCQEVHPACKTEWWGGVGVVICLEWGADCLHMVQLMPLHPKTTSSLASFKSRLVLPLWYRLTQVVLEKRPLNGSRILSKYW